LLLSIQKLKSNEKELHRIIKTTFWHAVLVINIKEASNYRAGTK